MNRTRAEAMVFAVLRIAAGLFFMMHGGQKLFGWFGGLGGHTAAIGSMMGVAGIVEFFGGLCVLLGLFTHLAAMLCSGEMAVAYFMQHFPNGTWPIQNHGEPAVLYCFVFLFFMVYGGGAYSLDALLFHRARTVGRHHSIDLPAHA